jgi:hypothetical protein
MNPDQRHKIPLPDYKSMSHEQFLDQIKILFALDNMTKDRLREICVKAGNYIFVCDNFIKIVRILLNIEAIIPVILMGETGVGKTKIFEMLSTLYGKGNLNWKKLEIHAGITDEDIVNFIEEIIKEGIRFSFPLFTKETVTVAFESICSGLFSEKIIVSFVVTMC